MPARDKRIRKLAQELNAAIRELREVIDQIREVDEPAAASAADSDALDAEKEGDTD